MTNEKNKKNRRGVFAGYGLQVLYVPVLAGILLSVFWGSFGYDINIFWTNVFVIAIWSILVVFAFLRRPHGEVWRDYRWIIAPSVLILLFLFDTSWAQSTLSTPGLKMNIIEVTSPDAFQMNAEYPLQISFDETVPSEIHLWVTGTVNCVDLEISGDGLLFAVKPPPDEPLEWSKNLPLEFDKTKKAMTILVQPEKLLETNSEVIWLNITSGGKYLKTQNWAITVESKHDFQIRTWKKNFLDTGSTVVSLITAVFVGVKQLEEEKKRQRAERIKQTITAFDTDVKSDFSKMLEEHLVLTPDWNEWEKGLQDQFRDTYSSFIVTTEDLWDALANQSIEDLQSNVDLCLQVCKRIFEDEEEKPVSTLKELQSAFRQDEDTPLVLLTILKEHPASIDVVKQIVVAFPPEIKKKAVVEYVGKFPDQIRALRVELDFPDLESFPLQGQFSFYKKNYASEDQLTAWLTDHGLDCSPFADAENPFYSVLGDQLLVDLAPPGFTLPMPEQNLIFEFVNSWDAGAGLFEYCHSFQSNFRVKEDIFFVVITPSLVEDYGVDHSRNLYLHALAEQWIWSLAETPTLFYSLKGEYRDLVRRLLRWHNFSPTIIAYKIGKFGGRLQEEKNKQAALLSGIAEWLSDKDATDLRVEEINALMELQPYPKHTNLFLISTIDLNPNVEKQIFQGLHKKFADQSDWLIAHNCRVVNFSIGTKGRQTVNQSGLVNQCKIRVRKCSGNKLEFNQLFDAPGEEPDVILARKADGSPGKMVRLGQKLFLQHVAKSLPEDYLKIEDLINIE